MKNTIKTLLVVVAAGLSLMACTPDEAATSPTSTSPTSTAPVTKIVEITDKPITEETPRLDDLGYGKLRLGMSYNAAKKTGMWQPEGGPPGGDVTCVRGNVTGTDMGTYLSGPQGLSSIFLGATTKTVKGIGIGSTLADLKAAYPSLEEYVPGLYIADAAPDSYYVFVLADDKVRQGAVNLRHQLCHS